MTITDGQVDGIQIDKLQVDQEMTRRVFFTREYTMKAGSMPITHEIGEHNHRSKERKLIGTMEHEVCHMAHCDPV